MTQTEVFLTGLRALRHTLAAAVDQLDIVLDAAEKPQEPAATADTRCSHPPGKRLDKRSMGHPTRFHCTNCNQDVEA